MSILKEKNSRKKGPREGDEVKTRRGAVSLHSIITTLDLLQEKKGGEHLGWRRG